VAGLLFNPQFAGETPEERSHTLNATIKLAKRTGLPAVLDLILHESREKLLRIPGIREQNIRPLTFDFSFSGEVVGTYLISKGHRQIAYFALSQMDRNMARLSGIKKSVGDLRAPNTQVRSFVGKVNAERRARHLKSFTRWDAEEMDWEELEARLPNTPAVREITHRSLVRSSLYDYFAESFGMGRYTTDHSFPLFLLDLFDSLSNQFFFNWCVIN